MGMSNICLPECGIELRTCLGPPHKYSDLKRFCFSIRLGHLNGQSVKNKAYRLTIELANVNAQVERLKRLCVCRDSCPTELVTSISTSIHSSYVLPREKGALERLGEVEVLNPAMRTTYSLAVVGEEVEALLWMTDELGAGCALKRCSY